MVTVLGMNPVELAGLLRREGLSEGARRGGSDGRRRGTGGEDLRESSILLLGLVHRLGVGGDDHTMSCVTY
jgi:hypothetical protein